MKSAVSTSSPLARSATPPHDKIAWQKIVPFLFLLPALVTLLLFRIVPAIYTVISSFQHNGEWVGFENYRFLFTSETVISS
ncbi:MAG: hypothetical protein AAF125_12700, partial [Chloroflexota bacterium]